MSVDRITHRSLSDTALRGLQSSLGRVQNLQEQLSSGKRISRPSDDPSGSAAAMSFRSQRQSAEQYLRNIDQAGGRLAVTDAALTTLSDRLRGVRDLLLQSRSSAVNSESRGAMAANITAIRSEVLDLLNTRYLDRPVFAGTTAGTYAVDPSSGSYLGDDQPVEMRISRDAMLRVDVKGTDLGADTLPGLLTRFADNVRTTGAADPDIDDLDAAMSQVLSALGDVGARAARVETTKHAVDSLRLDLTARISESEDVDLPETIMQLQAQQVAYQAALGAAAKIQQTSLMDFLR